MTRVIHGRIRDPMVLGPEDKIGKDVADFDSRGALDIDTSTDMEVNHRQRFGSECQNADLSPIYSHSQILIFADTDLYSL